MEAEGLNDTLHYLWDFTQKPSIFMAATSVKSQLNISWDHFKGNNSKSITFSEEPIYSFGIVLDKVS